MPHPTHRLKCYTGDVRRPVVFCSNCGVEDHENAIDKPCLQTFYVGKLDLNVEKVHPKFVSGLPSD